jgi:alpha-ribazole phosphatase
MNLFLVRHTETEATAGRCIGQSNVALSEKGSADVAKLVEQLKPLAPSVMISSDLLRCRVLAEALAKAVKVDVVFETAWREINFGQWEGKTWDEIYTQDRARYEAWTKDFVTIAPPEGESFVTLQLRIARAMNALSAYQAETIVVVTHAGAIRAALSCAMGLPLERTFAIGLNNGAVVHLRKHTQSEWILQNLSNSLLSLPCDQPTTCSRSC